MTTLLLGVSPCGSYRITTATPEDARHILSHLPAAELDERARLGIEGYEHVHSAVAEGRAWTITNDAAPLALLGVSLPHASLPYLRYVWFLATTETLQKHHRAVADKATVAWALDYVRASLPEDDAVLFNGVTLENSRAIKWLDRIAGARFADAPLPAGPNGHLALPYFLVRNPDPPLAGAEIIQ